MYLLIEKSIFTNEDIAVLKKTTPFPIKFRIFCIILSPYSLSNNQENNLSNNQENNFHFATIDVEISM